MAKRAAPKPAERFDEAEFEGEAMDPHETYEGRLEAWLDQRDLIVELHLRERP